MPADSGSTKLPAPFGKYLLTQLIAVGGMAEVYRAKIFGASGFEKEMVVKRILPKYAQNPNFVQMLIDEAKIAVSLSHGNIVPIYELGELEGSYYIAMEYVEGRTVLDILRDAHSKRHPLPWPYCLGIAADVAKGLAYAHGKAGQDGKPLGLVHRDINPRNIVITPAGEVKILDFGIARASTKRHQTASGVIKGTPGYMSPEQMYGQHVDNRSDLYCLGILVYELLTLRRLFPVWDVSEMRAVFEAGPIPLPSSIARHVDRNADAVIMKALAQNVAERFQSASEFEEELRHVIARSGTAVTSGGLAREIVAVDDAPGPKAPKTSPPVVSSQVDAPVSADTAPQRPSSSPPQSAPQPEAPVAQSLGPVSSTAATITARKTPLRDDIVVPVSPSPYSSQAQPSLSQPSLAQPQNPSRDVRTQPMPLTKSAPANLDAAHSFVIALEPGKDAQRALSPLPSTSAAATAGTTRTQVLAQNAELGWAGQIGEDAEFLALMKATGAAPGAGRRTMLIAAAVAVVALLALFLSGGPDLKAMAKRAFSGKKAELGVVVVKTKPSGADVVLDGRNRGKTNLKVAGIDVDEPHRLVVTPQGKEPIIIEFTRAEFAKGEDGNPTFLFEKDLNPPPPDAGPAAEPPK